MLITHHELVANLASQQGNEGINFSKRLYQFRHSALFKNIFWIKIGHFHSYNSKFKITRDRSFSVVETWDPRVLELNLIFVWLVRTDLEFQLSWMTFCLFTKCAKFFEVVKQAKRQCDPIWLTNIAQKWEIFGYWCYFKAN